MRKAISLLTLGIVCLYFLAFVSIASRPTATAQTMHPDVIWVWRLVDSLERRVERLEQSANR
jgi:hypothetical protein